MRVLLTFLTCLAMVVLLAVVAVCGVVGLVEAPMEAGLTLAEVAPEFAECLLGATALDVEHLIANIACERCPVDLELPASLTLYAGASERLRRPSKRPMGTNSSVMGRESRLAVRGPGVHASRG